MRVNRGRKDDPLGPSIAAQKIDCRIIPRQPSQDRHCRAGKCGYPNRSMPRLESEHCDDYPDIASSREQRQGRLAFASEIK
jgi:hypothetical protein